MATKVFPHAVIWDGKIVPPNTPIEVKEEKQVEEEKPKKRGAK